MPRRAPLIVNLIPIPITELSGLARTARDLDDVLRRAGYRVRTIDPPTVPRLWPSLVDKTFGHLYGWRHASGLVRRRADLVIGHNGAGWGLRGVRRVCSWQNESGEYSRWTWPAWHPNRWKLRHVDTACEWAAGRGASNYTVSHQMAENFRRCARVRIRGVIENAVDTAHFRPLGAEAGRAFRRAHGVPLEGPPMLLWAGRPVNYKGLWLLREWLERFEGRVGLILAGPDTIPPELAGLRGIHPVGRIGYDELPMVYAAADFFALPSAHEGCSYAVIEAMACGVPSLLSEAGHVRTIARRSPGLADVIAPLGDLRRLTGVLERWLARPEEARAVGERMRLDAVRHNALPLFERRWLAAVERELARQDLPKVAVSVLRFAARS